MDIFDFKYFQGVVEDIDDPRKLGRVRVRIFGLHSDKTVIDEASAKGIPTNMLPWASVMMPTTSASIHGFGENHGLLEGSWVVGVSRDGQTYNDLVIIGTIQGQPTEENPNPSEKMIAFHGEDGQWPDKEFLDEPDVNRHARNELGHKDDKWKSVPNIKKEERVTGIPIAGGGSWNEKNTSYAAEYPHNKVRSGPSRHLLEFDETPGAERLAEFHGPSHSYREIHPDGSQQIKIVGDNYTITLKDHNLYVQGQLNITAVGDANILTQGNANIQSMGDTNVTAQNLSANVANNASVNATTVNIQSSAIMNMTTGAAMNLTAAGLVTIQGTGVIIRGQKTENW